MCLRARSRSHRVPAFVKADGASFARSHDACDTRRGKTIERRPREACANAARIADFSEVDRPNACGSNIRAIGHVIHTASPAIFGVRPWKRGKPDSQDGGPWPRPDSFAGTATC